MTERKKGTKQSFHLGLQFDPAKQRFSQSPKITYFDEDSFIHLFSTNMNIVWSISTIFAQI